MALLQEEPCEGSGAREVEHLPETCCFPRGELSLGSGGCAGLLPKWCEHTLPPSDTAGIARFTGLERENISKGQIPLACWLVHIIIR